MLLTVDVGNTETVLGLFAPAADGPGHGPEVVRQWRLHTDARRTADELALTVCGLLGEDAGDVTGVAALSTVPAALRELRRTVERTFAGVPTVVIEPGVRTGVPLLVDNPREVGADRVVNTLAAHHLFDTACVVVDFGTSTNIDVVSARGEFLGGALAPGIEISLDALASRAAALRHVELVRPRSVIGRSTVEALQSGILYGFAGQVDGLVGRIRRELVGSSGDPVAVVATGGLAPLVVADSETITHHEPDLTLLGLALVFDRIQARNAERPPPRGRTPR